MRGMARFWNCGCGKRWALRRGAPWGGGRAAEEEEPGGVGRPMPEEGEGVPVAAVRPMIGPMPGDAGEDACRPAMLPVNPIIDRDPGSGEWLNERRLGEQ